jgi:hypothetical protein
MPVSATTRSLWRKAPAAEYDFLDEKAGQPEKNRNPLAG